MKLFFILLLTGKKGFTTEKNAHYLLKYKDIYIQDNNLIDIIIESNLFNCNDDQIIPSSRNLAEYITAKYLSTLTTSKQRILKIIFDKDNNIISDLQGVFGWYTTMNKNIELLKKHAVTMINNGDLLSFNNNDKQNWFKEYIDKVDLETNYSSPNYIWENINMSTIKPTIINILNNSIEKYQLINIIHIINKSKNRMFDTYICNLLIQNKVNSDVQKICLQFFKTYKEELSKEIYIKLKKLLFIYNGSNRTRDEKKFSILLEILYPKYLSIDELGKLYKNSYLLTNYWEEIFNELNSKQSYELLLSINNAGKLRLIQHKYLRHQFSMLDLIVTNITISNNDYNSIYDILILINSKITVYYPDFIDKFINTMRSKYKLLYDITILDCKEYRALINNIIFTITNWKIVAKEIFQAVCIENNISIKNKLIELLFNVTFYHYGTNDKESEEFIYELIKDNKYVDNQIDILLKQKNEYDDIYKNTESKGKNNNSFRETDLDAYYKSIVNEVENGQDNISSGNYPEIIVELFRIPKESVYYEYIRKNAIYKYMIKGSINILKSLNIDPSDILYNRIVRNQYYVIDKQLICTEALDYMFENNKQHEIINLPKSSLHCIFAFILTDYHEDKKWIDLLINNNMDLFYSTVKSVIIIDKKGTSGQINYYLNKYIHLFSSKQLYSILSSIPLRIKDINLIRIICRRIKLHSNDMYYQRVIQKKIKSKSISKNVLGAFSAALLGHNNKVLHHILSKNSSDIKFITGFVKYFYYSYEDHFSGILSHYNIDEIKLVLSTLVEKIQPVDDDIEGIAVLVTDERLQQMFVNRLINELKEYKNTNTLEVIDKIYNLHINHVWKTKLLEVIIHINNSIIFTSEIGYDSDKVIELIEKDKALSPSDLQYKIIETMDVLNRRYRDGEDNEIIKFWEYINDDPKIRDENIIRDFLRRDLLNDFPNTSKEKYVKNDKRVDIVIEENGFEIPIEIKKQSSRELVKGLTEQLYGYMKTPNYLNHGIYLIIWTDAIYFDNGLENKPSSAKELQDEMEKLVNDFNQLNNCKIVPFILDLSLEN